MTILTYLSYGALSFVISLITIAVLRSMALRYHWMDVAGEDPLKVHVAPVPFVGGFGIALGTLVSAGVVTMSFPGEGALFLVMTIALSVLALGAWDDLASMKPVLRLVAEIAAGVALAVIGSRSNVFHPSWGVDKGSFVLITILTLIFVAGSINAVNMLDGLDGLAGGIGLISCLGFGLAAVSSDSPLLACWTFSLGGALIGFLLYNFHPASVFMGDNGSYFLGFMLAFLGLSLVPRNFAAVAGVVLIIGAPVFDAAFAIVRRLLKGVSPFQGDRSHFYDLLSQRGIATRNVALLCYLIQIGFVTAGIVLYTWPGRL